MVLGLTCEWRFRSSVNPIPIRYWDKKLKMHLVPLYNKANIRALIKVIKNGTFVADENVSKEIRRAIKWSKANDKAYRDKSLAEFEGSEHPLIEQFGKKLYPKQQRIYEIASNVSGYPLYMEPGTGKTMTSLAMIGFHMVFKKAKKIIIIYHNPNIDEWVQEFKDSFWLDNLRLIDKGKVIKKPKKHAKNVLTIKLFNYETVAKNLEELIEWQPHAVFVDEFHKIKNVSSKRTWDIIKLGDFTPHRYGLTGTDVDGKYVDYFAEYRFLNPDILEATYDDYLRKYCIVGRHKNVEAYRNVELLKTIIDKYSYRIMLKDIKGMKSKKILEVPLINANLKWYNRMASSRVINIKDFRARSSYTISKRRKLLEITSGFITGDFDYQKDISPVKRFKVNPKLDWVRSKLLRTKLKTIVYCNRLEEVKMVAEMCDREGLAYQLLTGEIKVVKTAKENFRDNVDILIAMVQKTGTGLNLQFCNQAIYYSLPESWIDYEQSMKRIYRNKQKRNCKFYILLVNDSEDHVVYEALKLKKNYMDYIREG